MALPAAANMSFTAHVASQFTTYETDRKMQSQDAVYTTSNGVPMPHPYESQRVGESGPLLQQDFHLIDLLSHFDRERIPERVLSQADLFGTKGKKCPVTVRFSTVGGEAGSHDLARDPRGFAVKFRTEDGNWDLVANNTPVFFLRDPAKFLHFIHTQKRDPSTHLSSSDDSTMFWDYLCNNPESVHQVMVLLGDRGIPDGYRHMHGYSGHTFKFVNAAGEWVYVQIHMKSMQGARFITQEDSVKLSPDYSQKDLYEAIARGDFPRWSVEIQTMTEQQGEEVWVRQGINVLDLTHVWPQGQFPRRKVGEFTLNENAVNYFAEIEQAAFNPAHMPLGIEPSADPVLQSRLFSYPDTHRHRIGVNYQQLPVNAPRTAYWPASFQRDGGMAFFNQGSRSNYLSSIDPVQFRSRSFDPRKVHGSSFSSDAILFLSEIRPEDFNAPRALWQKVWDEPARQRFISNVAGKMAVCRKPELLKRQIAIFREVDPDIASRLEKATGIHGYDGIAGMRFNGTHNGMAKNPSLRLANGLDVSKGSSLPMHNGAPVKSAAKGRGHANGVC
ncbi:catalase-like domain-containing protein [Lasiosphaeria miniovina]|uniref:Catalase-like domain-containing protein n=1 Tax=Lasiosphaeria miniovina TaxID=1954250 RepID=A0AA40E4G5_9PEZI|nr:catalase-like domain-containing protein [Lasiosphaeria miniovina]KAK0727759.1 catalase-like domain-containing protein [Lasiosphaeria miniovina]